MLGTVVRTTITRLKDCPLSFRDVVGQVAEYQRIVLDLTAMLDYLTLYEPRLAIPVSEWDTAMNSCLISANIMGCFTSDLEVAQKFLLMMIPVWLVRDEAAIPTTIKIKAINSYTPQSSGIIVDDWVDEVTGLVRPFPILHEGCSGPAQHSAACRMGSAFADLINLENPLFVRTTGNIAVPVTTTSIKQVELTGKVTQNGSRGSRKVPCMFILYFDVICWLMTL
jgi:hypothetical protein